MADKILVVGAGGLAKETTDVLAACGYEVEAFYAEPAAQVLHPIEGAPLVRSLDEVRATAAVIAIGDTAARKRFHLELCDRFELPVIVHPSAIVSPSARLADGVLVMQNAVVNADAVIEAAALVNVGCYVAHDCCVGAYAHLAGACQLGGGVSVGAGVFCGTASVVLPNLTIGAWSVCGAGAVVTSDVADRTLVVGVPARAIKSL